MIDAGHDVRVARILLGRINAQMHSTGPLNQAPRERVDRPDRA